MRVRGHQGGKQLQQQRTGGEEVEIGVLEAGGGNEKGKDQVHTDSEAPSLRSEERGAGVMGR